MTRATSGVDYCEVVGFAVVMPTRITALADITRTIRELRSGRDGLA
jgi:hypothetical protein